MIRLMKGFYLGGKVNTKKFQVTQQLREMTQRIRQMKPKMQEI